MAPETVKALTDSLTQIASAAPGEVGIAVIVNGCDTVTVNDTDKYPLMSVFKLHQAVAVCHYLERKGVSIDTVLHIDRQSLSPDTWSPMLKDSVGSSPLDVSVRTLMRYTLQQSDNNASNVMFDSLIDVMAVDEFIATLVPRTGFRLEVRESDMASDHSLSYRNHSSPLSAAMLLERLFTDSVLSVVNQEFILDALRGCSTGADRLPAPLAGIEGVEIAHKTGSGYVSDAGKLVAFNDAAHIVLPGGDAYTLVVFIKDFDGTESEASAVMSRISGVTYRLVSGSR